MTVPQLDNVDSGSHDSIRRPRDEPNKAANVERPEPEPDRTIVSLRSLIQPYALPAQPTPIVARDALVARMTGYLDTPQTRLLTLIGPGGVGKTRLACEIARRREREHEIVCFIDLAQFHDGGSVAAAIHEALGTARVVHESPAEQNLVVLGNRRALLVLDNFEHVIDAAAQVAEMLADAPWLQIIVTSRTALRLRWELVCAVPPLALPPDDEHLDLDVLATVPSVALFITFVRRIKPEFELTVENAPIVSEICRRMDGLPLALELAAADLRTMSIERLLERIDRPLDTLVRGPRDLPHRQQTMRATIEWSYALLSPADQRIVRQLAVFAGSATVPAVAGIVGLSPDAAYDALVNLAEQNLLEVVEEPHSEPRFRMQHMVHDYLVERLALDREREALRERFIAWYSALATENAALLGSPRSVAALRTIEAEIGNLRAIMEMSIREQAGSHGLRLALTLAPLWACPGRLSEGRRWLDRLIDVAPDDDPMLRAEACLAAARLAVMAGNLSIARQMLDEARAESDRLEQPELCAVIMAWSCYVRLLRGDLDGAATMLETAPELRGPNRARPGDINASVLRALVAAERGDDHAAVLLVGAQEAADLGEDHVRAIELRCTRAELALIAGEHGTAARLYAEALVRAQVAGSPRARIRPLLGLGDIAADQSTLDEALHHYRDAFEIARDYEDERAIIQILERMAVLGVSTRIIPNLLRMSGLAAAMRARLDAGRSTFDIRRVTPKLEHAIEMLGKEEFDRILAEGETLTLAQVAAELTAGASRQRRLPPSVTARSQQIPSTLMQLTRREREVVQQISRGHTNRQIAANLGMAERTVDSHIGNIRQKLQIPSRAQIAVWAVANGLARPE